MKAKFGKTEVEIIHGDITKMKVDSIVNAANSRLRPGGGVDGAIHRAGGPEILQELKKYNGCPTGQVVVTGGGNMKVKYVIHTVGPVWKGGGANEKKLLSDCYRNSLKKAVELGINSIAFPSISTGVYGYPFDDACRVALKTIKEFLSNTAALEKVYLVTYGKSDFERYKEIFKEFI